MKRKPPAPLPYPFHRYPPGRRPGHLALAVSLTAAQKDRLQRHVDERRQSFSTWSARILLAAMDYEETIGGELDARALLDSRSEARIGLRYEAKRLRAS